MEPLKYFEDFLSIPRESGNEKEISSYLVEFAKKNELEYYVDDIYNVIIKRKSNNNSNDTIILQGHIDMVCTSIDDYDFKNKGIDWYIDNNMYKAKGTTLGADNGIGCSIILAILSNKDILVPNIEAIFTVQEETTMEGAKKLDYSKITGNKLISIDGTNEGVIEVSSAGMTSITLSKQLEYTNSNFKKYKISIDGLEGGHSGVDINKNRGNSIKIIGDIIGKLNNYYLIDIQGGSKDNVIPSECVSIISTDEIIDIDNSYKEIYPNINILIEEIDIDNKVICKEDSKMIIDLINNLPIEVLSYRGEYPQTSLNLATIKCNNSYVNINISIRSSNVEDEKKCVEMVRKLSNNMNFKINSTIPYFTFNENSKLRDILVNKYKELYNKDIVLEHVHAGLEGGVFSEHINDLDVCVIAPNLHDIHTVNECVEIDSVNRVYKWLIEVLKEI